MAQERPDFLLSDFNIYLYNIVLTEVSGTAGAAAYDAALRVHAGYGQAEIEPFEGFRIAAGVRYEEGRSRSSDDLFGLAAKRQSTRIDDSYWLPAATVTVLYRDCSSGPASKTSARPRFASSRRSNISTPRRPHSSETSSSRPRADNARRAEGLGREDAHRAGFFKQIDVRRGRLVPEGGTSSRPLPTRRRRVSTASRSRRSAISRSTGCPAPASSPAAGW